VIYSEAEFAEQLRSSRPPLNYSYNPQVVMVYACPDMRGGSTGAPMRHLFPDVIPLSAVISHLPDVIPEGGALQKSEDSARKRSQAFDTLRKAPSPMGRGWG
jgi:hypothetical protein